MSKPIGSVLASVLLAALLAVAPLVTYAAYAQQAPSGAINPRANVKESIMRLYVYPDGSVQPYYKLVATIDLGSDTGLRGHLVYESRGVLKANLSRSTARLDMDISGPSIRGSGGIGVNAGWRYRSLGGGDGDASLNLLLSWWNATSRERIVVKEFRLEAQGGEKATLYLDVVAPTRLLRSALEKQGITSLTPDEVNRELQRRHIDYIRVKSLTVSMLENGTTEIKLIAEENIRAMISQAVANGMPGEDARELLRLLRSSARVSGDGQLSFRLEVSSNRATASMKYVSTDRGDLADAELAAQKAMPLLIEALTYLVKPYVEQNPEPALIIAEIQAGLQRSVTPLVRAAPSTSNTTMKLTFNGRYVDVYIEYYGARLRVPSNEAPGVVAEKTLTVVSQQLRQMLQSLGVLQAYVPGLAAAVPNRVELVPVGGVKVSQRSATINQLPLVHVTVVAAPTKTATPPSQATTSAAVTGAGTAVTTTSTRQPSTPPPPPPATSPGAASAPAPPAATTGAAPGGTGAATGGTVSTEAALAIILLTLAAVAAAAALLLRRGQA